MSKEEFMSFADVLNGNWDKWLNKDNAIEVKTRYACLKDLDFEMAIGVAQKLIMTMHFAPKVADIREAYFDMATPPEAQMTPQEAWSYIERAIGKSTYYAQESFDALPPILKKCTSPDQLHTLATDENYNSGVESSNFFRTYNELLRREKEFNQLSPTVQQMVLGVSNTLGIEEK